jgi:hypothetical protein
MSAKIRRRRQASQWLSKAFADDSPSNPIRPTYQMITDKPQNHSSKT